jgi:hypothetical protein
MNTLPIGFQPSPSLLARMPSRRQKLSPRFMFLLASCCLLFHPGCLAIPIPQGYRNIERAGKKIEPYKLSFVVPGQTTKTEFIDKVGKPYLMMDDYGVMAYYWKMLSASVLWAVGAPGGGAGGIAEVQPQYLLLVSYDDQGVIHNYETIRIATQCVDAFSKNSGAASRSKTVNEYALEWIGKSASLGKKFSTVDGPAGKSVMYVFHRVPDGLQRARFIDGVFLDGNLWAEVKPGQYVSIIVSPGFHAIGFEQDIRTTDKFLHPDREAPVPSLTDTIDTRPNQVYFLEISFIERDSRDFKKTAVFSRLSEDVALPKLAGLTKAR